MIETIQIRRDTAANWTSVNPVLAQCEVGIEWDTGKAKLGDGVSAWMSLAYWNPSGLPGGGPGTGYLAPDGSGAALTGITAEQVGAVPLGDAAPLNTTDPPQNLGTATPGSAASASASDHVHQMPALTSLTDQDGTALANGTVPTWNAAAGKFTQQVPAVPVSGLPLWAAAASAEVTLQRGHEDDSSSYTATPPSGTEHFTYFRALSSRTVTTVSFQTGSAAAATSTLARVGLYSVNAGTGVLTLVASCANKTTFSGTFAGQTCSLTASYPLAAGTIYAVGLLQVAATPASLLGQWFNGAFLGAAPALAGTKSGQSDLASTASGLSAQQFPVYYELK